MKKCKKCGAVQNDERTTCVDCGAMLGRPMTEAEEEQSEAELDDRLDGMAERTQDFYVSLPEKIMGILCILGVIAAVMMLNLVGAEKPKLEELVPEHMMITHSGFGTVTAMGFDPGTGEFYEEEIPDYYYTRRRELNNAAQAGLCGLIASAMAVPMLLVPRFIWWLDTLKFRLWYDWEPSPTYFSTMVRKILSYLLSAVGIGGVIYSYFLYFA